MNIKVNDAILEHVKDRVRVEFGTLFRQMEQDMRKLQNTLIEEMSKKITNEVMRAVKRAKDKQ